MEEVSMAGNEVTVVDVAAPTKENGEKLPGESLLNREDAQENMERLMAELDSVSRALRDSELKAKRADELEDQLCSLQEELRSLHEKILEKEKVEASMNNDSEVKVSEKESFGDSIKWQEQVVGAQEEVAKAVAEKEALEAARKELTEDLEQMRGRCVYLESELRLSREEFGKVDELVAVVQGKNTELEEKLKSLERLLEEYREEETSSVQEKQELQDLVRATNTALEKARLELQERDVELKAANQKKIELEDQLNLSESKYDDADRSLQEHRSKISQLESALSESSVLKSELENRIEELEQEMETFEQKRRKAESESEKYSDMASELKIELGEAGKRKRELTESLNAIMEEKKETEEALHDSVGKLHDAEHLIEGLRSELSATQEKLQGTEDDLRDAEIRECEILEKLKCAEGKLEQQERVLEVATAEITELESLNATLREETKLQLEVLNNKDSELQIAEHQKQDNEEKASEAAGKIAALEEELDRSSKKLASLESLNEELRNMLADAESKVGELQVLLNLAVAEKQEVEELRKQLARSHERQSEVEASFLQAQAEINEAGLKLSQKEMEAKELSELLSQAEEKLKIYEVQLREFEARVESTEGKLRQASVKMAFQENMIEKLEDVLSQLEMQNGDLEGEKRKLKAELAELESKLNGLQKVLSASLEERDGAVGLLQSQVSSIMEEKQAMKSELTLTQGKLWSVEDDLKDAAIKEGVLLEKLRSAEGQVYQKGKALEEANARNMELESLSARLTNDIELKLQEVTEILNRKEAEIRSFAEKMQTVTYAKMDYEEQAAQAADKVAALEDELDLSSEELASLESLNEELKKMLEDAKGKGAETLSENEHLAKTNLDLKSKVGELQELLESAFVEKLEVVQQLASSMNATEELKNQLAMSHKLQSEAEARFLQAQTELNEATQRLNEKEFEAKKLSEELSETEERLNRYQIQLHNSAALAESRKYELAQTFAELQDQEGKIELLEAKLIQLQAHNGDLEEANLKLKEKVAESESKLSGLREEFFATLKEKGDAADSFQSQIALIMEQKQLLESELIATRGKLQSIEDDLKGSKTREDEIVKRLKYAEGQAEQQGKALEEANAKILLAEAMGTLDSKEAEAKVLAEKLQLRNPHIKPSEHQSEVEARFLQVHMELREKTEILTQKELEAKALNARLGQLEAHNGMLVEEKMKFEEELAGALIRLNDLQAELSAKTAEKDAAVENFNSSMKMIEDLKQEWAFERQSFESKIASIIEQKEDIKKAAAVSQNALQVLIGQLEGRLKESKEGYESLKAELENLKVKAAKTTALQTRVEELKEQLLVTKEHFTKEMENVCANFAAREIELTSKLEQLTQKTQHEDAPIEKKEKNSEMAPATEDEIQQATEEQVNQPEQKLQEEETKPGSIVVAGKTEMVQANEGKNIKAVIGVALMSIIMGLVLKRK